jgi:aldose 1-epimerase
MIPLMIGVLLMPLMRLPADYSAERISVDGIETIRLSDARHRTQVSIVPSIGNNAYEMTVNGKQLLWSPYRSLAEFRNKPVQLGNPLLAPWANRIDGDVYWANDRQYRLNPDLNNYRYDANHKPIHGLLAYAREWEVIRVQADRESASVTSKLEFWRHPGWMAQFPFAHTITMTYRLSDGRLEVETSIENLSAEPMPLSLGYHTYYRLEDSSRDEWRVHVAARESVSVSQSLIPTGLTEPAGLADPQPLRGFNLDSGFINLVRDKDGRAEFWVEGRKQKVKVLFGPKFDVAIVFAPPGRDFICFEPMVGLTNAFNLAHTGLYKGLQSIPPGGVWKESFWIAPENFDREQ